MPGKRSPVTTQVKQFLESQELGYEFDSASLAAILGLEKKNISAVLTYARRAGWAVVRDPNHDDHNGPIPYRLVSKNKKWNVSPNRGAAPFTKPNAGPRVAAKIMERLSPSTVKSLPERMLDLAAELENYKPDLTKVPSADLIAELYRRQNMEK